MTTWLKITIIALLSLGAYPAYGQGNELQIGGRITDASGNPAMGPVDLVFKFYDQANGGNQLGGSVSKSSVPLTQGVFQTGLDLAESEKTIIFGSGHPVYLEVIDVTNGRKFPRQLFGSVPYAMRIPVDEKTLSFDGTGKLTVGSGSKNPGDVLTVDGSGNLSWGPSSGGLDPSGGSMSGDLDMGGTNSVTNIADPTNPQDAATKNYVDTITLKLGTLTTAEETALIGTPLVAGDAGKSWYNSDTNKMMYWNGTTAVELGAAGSGLSDFNGMVGATQSLGVPGSSGTAPNWISGANTHTLNIPDANAAGVTGGLISKAEFDAFDGKQDAITTGAATEYLKGDLSLGTFATDVAATAAVTANTSGVATNNTAISTNAANISSNDTDIANNAANISSNDTDIATNATAIGTNTTNISSNDTDIATNATNISANDTDIATNASNIATNTTAIGTKAADSAVLKKDGSVALTSNWGLGGYDLTGAGNVLISDDKSVGLGKVNTADEATFTTGWDNTQEGYTWFDPDTNSVKYWDGSSIQTLGVSGAGLTSLGGQSGGSQTFDEGSAGTSHAISSAGNVHTLNIPHASGVGVTSGTISNTDYVNFVGKQAAITTGATTEYLKGDLSLGTFATDVAATAAVTANTSGVAANNTAIGTNATNISSNDTDIASNASAIATNTTNISSNDTDIATNASNISSNDTDIATNASNIASNGTAISSNTTNIATKADDSAVLKKNGSVALTSSWNVGGTNTITNLPTPSAASDAASKSYVDDQVTAGSGWTDSGSAVVLSTTADQVGIGSISPNGKLDVVGGYSYFNGLRINGSDTSNTIYQNTGDLGIAIPNGGGSKIHIKAGTTGLTIDDTGNVGIGTTLPLSRMHVANGAGVTPNPSTDFLISDIASGTAVMSLLSSTVGQSEIYFGDVTDNQNGVIRAFGASHATRARDIDFAVNGAPRLTLDSTGNVGIGTTTPADRLHVEGGTIRGALNASGSSMVLTGSGSNLHVNHNGGSHVGIYNSGGGIQFRQPNGTTSSMTILSNGKVGVGDALPIAMLDVNSNTSGTPGTNGLLLRVANANLTDAATAAAGVATSFAVNSMTAPTILATNPSVTTGHATNLYMSGAPISGTNQSITDSSALRIAGGSVAGAGSVTNAYGLHVDAPSGATNNYAATFVSGNVGIGTTSPQSLLQVGGFLQIDTNSGTPNGADCDNALEYGRVIADTSTGENKLFLCTADGWQTFVAGGSVGITSCPAGFTRIGTAGKRGTFCIDSNERTGSGWIAAKDTCDALTHTEGDAYLCSHTEWYKACKADPTGDWVDDDEWVDETYGNSIARFVGTGSCGDFDGGSFTVSHPFRCCIQ